MKTALIAAVVALSLGTAARADDAQDLANFRAAQALGAAHLATFDTLDFDVFTGQKWDQLKESHGANVKVHWPDGHVTEGVDFHPELSRLG